MRTGLAWLFAIISLFVIISLLDRIASKLDLAIYINYSEPVTVLKGDGRYEESYTEEETGTVTDLGIFNIFLSFMFCWRIYHWVLSGSPSGKLTEDQRNIWLYLLMGAIAYMAISHFFDVSVFGPWSYATRGMEL